MNREICGRCGDLLVASHKCLEVGRKGMASDMIDPANSNAYNRPHYSLKNLQRWGEALDAEHKHGMGASLLGYAQTWRKQLEHANNELSSLSVTALAAVNPSVMDYISHWEGRALKAESELLGERIKREAAERRLTIALDTRGAT